MRYLIALLLALVILALLYFALFRRDGGGSEPLYKITTQELWEKSRGSSTLLLSPADTPFIHLAEKEDVGKTIAKFFPEEEQVVVLTIDPAKLVGRLVKEGNPGGSKEYYHLYEGSIPMRAITAVELR